MTMVAKNNKNQVLFDHFQIKTITNILGRINHLTEIDWKFTNDTLVVNGIEKDSITFTHPKSAKAFLDAYLIGYDHGYSDGRDFETGEKERYIGDNGGQEARV